MCQFQKLPRAFDLPQQSWKLLLCLQPGFSIQKWKEKFPRARRDVWRYLQGSSGESSPMCLKSQKLWEVEVGLSWVQSPLCKAEANSNWFIHAFIQQTLLEHLLYAKHYSSDGGYCDNTEKNIYSTGTSYHGERIRQQTKYSHVFGLSLLMMAWHSVMQWQLCWLNRGYRIHVERGSITRWRWCWLLAGSLAGLLTRVSAHGLSNMAMSGWPDFLQAALIFPRATSHEDRQMLRDCQRDHFKVTQHHSPPSTPLARADHSLILFTAEEYRPPPPNRKSQRLGGHNWYTTTYVSLKNPSWTKELGGLRSMGSQRVGHNWSDWAHTC